MYSPFELVGFAACFVQLASALQFSILSGTENRRCFGALPGSGDRSSVTIKIAGRRWVSHYIIHSVVEILLKEYLGYTTEYLDAPYNPRDLSRYAENDYDLDMEVWLLDDTSESYEQHVLRDASVVNPEPTVGIGYSGRGGVFTLRRTLAQSPFSDIYVFYESSNRAALKADNYVMFGEDGLHEFLASQGLNPFCVPEYQSCDPGPTQGYWIPPVCRARPSECAVLFRLVPEYDRAFFEQLTRNHNLSLINAYGGIDVGQHITRLAATGKQVVFTYWEPDPFPTSVDAVRVAYPDHSYGCDSVRPWRVDGPLLCDFPEAALQKLFSASLLQKAPEAFMVLRNMVVSMDQIRAMIGRTQEAGGPLTSYEAACEWVQAHQDVVATWAPPCVVTPGIPNVAFDPQTLTCKEGGLPTTPFTKTCSQWALEPVGTVDRRGTKVNVVRRAWLSHQVVSTIVQVLLKDFLGYSVVEVDALELSDFVATLGDLMQEGDVDMDAETWTTKESSFYQTYVLDRGTVLSAGAIGYPGRSGTYIFPSTHEQDRWSAWWRFYEDRSILEGSGLNFLRFGSHGPDVPTAREWLRASGSSPSAVCTASWCGTGQFEGFWVPAQCGADPTGCLLHIHAVSWYDEGYFEALTASRGHPFIHAYYGWGMEDFLAALQANHTYDIVFYGFEPDALILRLGAVRLSYPDYAVGCTRFYNSTPYGHVACDYPEVVLQKFASRDSRARAPESYLMLSNLEVRREEINAMMAQHTAAGGTKTDVHEIACGWLHENLVRVQTTIAPDCISKPKEPGTERLGDFIFDPDTVSCIEVACRPDEVLDVLNGILCRKCSEGLLPNEESTKCVPCTVGATPNRSTGQCELCPKGSFCTYGTELPTQCPSGTYAGEAGLTECARCGLGSYQSLAGQSACQPCKEPTTTPGLGSRYADECLCAAGFYKPLLNAVVQTTPGNSSTETCLPCPEGMECLQGSDMANTPCIDGRLVGDLNGDAGPYPVPEAKYYTACVAPLSVYKCITDTACPGGRVELCSPSFQGLACGGCKAGWYLSGLECAECWDVQKSKVLVPILMATVGPVAVPLMYIRKRDPVSRWNTPANHMASALFVGLVYVQTVAAVSACFLQKFSFMDSSSSWTSYALDVLSVLRPECAMFGEFALLRVANLLQPVYAAVVFVVVYWVSVALGQMRQALRMDGDLLSNCYWSLFNTFFIGISRQTLELFQCYDHPNGKSSLRSQSDVLCYSSEWDSVMIPSMAAVVLFCGGFIALNVWIMWVAPNRYHEARFQKRWKFIFVGFRPSVWWWGLVLLVKGLWLNLPAVIFDRGAPQIIWVEAAMLVYLMSCITLFPWRGFSVGVLDITIHTFLVGLTPLLYFFADPAPDKKERSGIGMAYTCVSMVPLLITACVILLLFLEYRRLLPMPSVDDWQHSAREACQTLSRLAIDEERLACVMTELPWFDLLQLQCAARLLQTEVFFDQRPRPLVPTSFVAHMFSGTRLKATGSVEEDRMLHRSLSQALSRAARSRAALSRGPANESYFVAPRTGKVHISL